MSYIYNASFFSLSPGNHVYMSAFFVLFALFSCSDTLLALLWHLQLTESKSSNLRKPRQPLLARREIKRKDRILYICYYARRFYDSGDKHAIDDWKEQQRCWWVWIIIFRSHSWSGRCLTFHLPRSFDLPSFLKLPHLFNSPLPPILIKIKFFHSKLNVVHSRFILYALSLSPS